MCWPTALAKKRDVSESIFPRMFHIPFKSTFFYAKIPLMGMSSFGRKLVIFVVKYNLSFQEELVRFDMRRWWNGTSAYSVQYFLKRNAWLQTFSCLYPSILYSSVSTPLRGLAACDFLSNTELSHFCFNRKSVRSTGLPQRSYRCLSQTQALLSGCFQRKTNPITQ